MCEEALQQRDESRTAANAAATADARLSTGAEAQLRTARDSTDPLRRETSQRPLRLSAHAAHVARAAQRSTHATTGRFRILHKEAPRLTANFWRGLLKIIN